MTIPAAEALQRLREGNARFSASVNGPDAFLSSGHRAELVQVQEPIAIVLGCSDARVPAEIVFDQGLGALFVIRVAGNIVAPSQVGSVEFAAERFGTRLVVVLGHSQCGAVLATIEALRNPDAQASANLRSIVDRVRPSVEEILRTDPHQEFDDLVHHAVRSNIRASVNHLRNGSALLERLISERGLMVVGAEYSLQTGKVEFFEGA
jgi:carbonic anhydrase